jgi:hypothetical protein
MDERACANTENRHLYKFRMWRINVRYKLDMLTHAAFWRTLYFFRLAGIYSRLMCRLGWYRKFPDGRCIYCGDDARQTLAQLTAKHGEITKGDGES